MAVTVNLVAHDLMDGRRNSLLVQAVYEIVVWTYVGGGNNRDRVDFSVAAGGGTGVTTRVIVPAAANIPARYLFRRVDWASPITLATQNLAAANFALLGYLVRTGATTFAMEAFGISASNVLATLGLAEVADTTNLVTNPAADPGSFVSATPSRARFTIIGQPNTDPVDTPINAVGA